MKGDTAKYSISVMNGSGGYILSSDNDPNLQVNSASITCTPTTCNLVMMGTTIPGGGGTNKISLDMTADATNNITGTGNLMITTTSGAICGSSFTITGPKQ